MTRKEIIQAAYRKFAEADRIWSANLKKKYGKRAGDMRYEPAGEQVRGYREFRASGAAWRMLVDEERETT